jgi:hypothetical protein
MKKIKFVITRDYDVITETFRAGYRIKEDTLTVTGYDIEEVE